MTVFPSKDDFLASAQTGDLVPVYADLTADFETPVSVYSKLRAHAPAFLFESIVGGEHISRYSFVGCSPRRIIASWPEKTVITERDGSTSEIPTPADPLTLIEEALAPWKAVAIPGMPPFIGGAVGFLGHEYIHRVEPTVPPAAEDVLGMPLMWFALMDTVVAFDHAKQIIRIVSNARLEDGVAPESIYAAACAEIERIIDLLSSGSQLAPMPLAQVDPADIKVPAGNFTRPEFEEIVERTKEYIRSGDVIQVVGSQRFEADFPQPPLDLYRALRFVNPSPYMFCLETGDYAVVGASPEVHVRSTAGKVEIRPIAGTRPRGKDEAEDTELEKDLLADAKERAEHLMLVDLARNDIGRVCEVGSVHVADYAIIERYSHVMHIVSQVEGQLAADKTPFDLMRATFPAGTLSGAPKIRAMQIISELEGQQRGVYGGALGYFSYDGNLDSCIAIRTALLKDGKIYIQSGAGLVADSVPASEYDETVNKAKGMLKAVALSRLLGGGAK
ncbi:anthranilate synthase component I [Cerasicoccus arenae]|uniref:Anthranilate synthase component 1 n=1 Tax=Cerasicoccus arenae TaxID=424488 RepID=A0A8J3DDQ7_9BACT|nr:anthranilate synthase component I [Cerasicoccus arenae]MBK1857407.1 anthranilate synthase component I [Cerasicoccus arenae]GHC07908.1 anthranilate synthase component I [Cerasicoccus arenae]